MKIENISMLSRRILTALVLLAVLAGALFAPTSWPFIVLFALITGVAAWEWTRMTLPAAYTKGGACTLGTLIALVAGTVAWSLAVPVSTMGDVSAKTLATILAAREVMVMPNAWVVPIYSTAMAVSDFLINLGIPLSALLWVGVVSIVVIRGRVDVTPVSIGWTLFAVLALLAANTALILFFIQYGAIFILSLLALVWVVDIAAYFGGRALGRHSLAARISPGKTLEGALIGAAAGILWVGISQHWTGTFAYTLVQRWGIYGALLMALLLAVLAIIGDLFESLLKRRAGRKDSSALLPGHGGVYDRIDAILPVVPMAFMLISA